MDEAPFSSTFALFLEGVRVQHTVRTEKSPQDHCRMLSSVLGSLKSCGYSAHEGGLEEGQARWDITGYVLARNEKGLMIWCYTEWGDWRVRGGTIYDRHFEKLPFDPKKAKVFGGESPPTRTRAKQDGFLFPCKMSILVQKTDRQTKGGESVWEFVDVLSGTAAVLPAAEKADAAVNKTADDESPEAVCQHICNYMSGKVGTIEEFDRAMTRAVLLKEKLGEKLWEQVVRVTRQKVAMLMAQASPEESVNYLSTIRKYREALGETVYVESMAVVRKWIDGGNSV